MKKILLISLTILTLSASARKNESGNQIVGTWKCANQSKVNDFQKVFTNNADYQTEHFTFEPNHVFVHSFINEKGNVVKVLKGKWKFIGDKVNITYADIDYSITTDYFYIGEDLILGQNFSHVIFTKDNTDFQNMASK